MQAELDSAASDGPIPPSFPAASVWLAMFCNPAAALLAAEAGDGTVPAYVSIEALTFTRQNEQLVWARSRERQIWPATTVAYGQRNTLSGQLEEISVPREDRASAEKVCDTLLRAPSH